MNIRGIFNHLFARPTPRNRIKFAKLSLHTLEDRLNPSGMIGFLPAATSIFNADPTGSTDAPLTIAREYLAENASLFGLSAADVADAIVIDQYFDDSTSNTYIVLRQNLNGLEVINSNFRVTVALDGRVVGVSGGFVAGLAARQGTTGPIVPVDSPATVLQKVATALGIETSTVDGFAPGSSADRAATGTAPALSVNPITLRLQYAPTEDGRAVLTWRMAVRPPNTNDWFDLAITDGGGQIVYQTNWFNAAQYRAVAPPNESPQDNGFTVAVDPQDPVASPFGWHDTNGVAGAEFTDTRGNNANVGLNLNGNSVLDADEGGTARPNGGAALDFATGFSHNPAAEPSTAQNRDIAQISAFHAVNRAHDVFYRYGFTETNGNFQVNNYGRGGTGGDPVRVFVQDSTATNNAFMATPGDGQSALMILGIFPTPTPDRDTALYNSVVIHEYGHGVSARLTDRTAGASSLSALQSGGMGEGWSDFYSLMFLQRATDTQNVGYGLGTYVLGQAQTDVGIRRFRYSFNMAVDPLTFDAFGTTGTTSFGVARTTQVHDVGEIWCSALWDMNWLFRNRYGFDANLLTGYNPTGSAAERAGNKLALELVNRGLLSHGSNPDFIQARDAILAADIQLTGGANQRDIWTAFARRGLGARASTPGANSSVINIDFSLPSNLSITASVSAFEGNSGTRAFNYTVSIPTAATQTVTVNYTTVDGTAIAGSDYVMNSGILTFNPGVTSQTISVLVNGDLDVENNETFTVRLTNPSNALFAGTATSLSGTGTIVNDDPTIDISAPQSVTEGNTGTTNVTFDVTLSAPSTQTITVNFATANGTASTLDNDYNSASGTVTFAPGQTMQQIVVQVRGDIKNELDEDFTINLTSPTNAFLGTASTTVTILNDDAIPKLNIATPVIVTEGNSGQTFAVFTVTLIDLDGQTVTVDFNTVDGSATLADGDYVQTSGTLTFLPGVTEQTFMVAVNGDTKFEVDETFEVALSNPGNAAIINGTATATIVNDDTQPLISITAPTNLIEGNSGMTPAVFTISLSNASDEIVMVTYGTGNGTATTGDGDYVPTGGTVTFNPGETSQTITVFVVGDLRNELDETFVVNLTLPSNGSLDIDQAVATIINDDPLPVINIGTPVMVTERNVGMAMATFTVTLDGPSGQTVQVGYSTADGTALLLDNDYVSTSGTLSFAPGVTSRTFMVAVINDLRNEENETFLVNLDSPVNGTIGTGTSTATINNDDPLPVVNLNTTPISITEGTGGTSIVTFTVNLAAVSGRTVTVDYTTLDGTATAGSDYQLSAETLTFLPGETSKTFDVTVIGDVSDELNETFSVSLLNPTNATIGLGSASATINDDDLPPTISIVPTLSLPETDVGSTTAQVMVSLSASSGLPVTVNFATSSGTASSADSDYVDTNGTLTFAPGETIKVISVLINGDRRSESDETFGITLSSPTNATIAAANSTVTILDDDPLPLLVISNPVVRETDVGVATAIFNVTLSAQSGRTITVGYTTGDGLARAGRDYVATSGTLTFAPGVVSQSFSVQVLADNIAEVTEGFIATLINPVNANISAGIGGATILDDDPTPTVITQVSGSSPVLLLDPSNGQTTTMPSPFPGFTGSIESGVGDIDGDGALDFVFGSGFGSQSHVMVISGQDGSIIYSFFSFRVEFLGGIQIAVADVNGDGRDDIITAAGSTGGPHVVVFSGIDLTPLFSFFAYDQNFTGGINIAAGDINGDGKADLITSTRSGVAPHVKAFSGADGSELASFFAYDQSFAGGVTVAVGDLDGDGKADIVTAAGINGSSHVRAFSGGDRSRELASFFAYSPNFLGSVQVGTNDIDGDGTDEIITGAGRGGSPHLKTFDFNGTELQSRLVGDPNFLGGIFVG